jgi:hypothetical protein
LLDAEAECIPVRHELEIIENVSNDLAVRNAAESNPARI